MSKRDEIVKLAKSYLNNTATGSANHKKIVDTYNTISPLPRGYKATYSDAWCAIFISAIAKEADALNIIPAECSCPKMIEGFKELGTWEENDAYTPNVGDIIFYDWDDNGSGDNVGTSDHVGFVASVSGSIVTTIEGNYSNNVTQRTISVNGLNIRGYGLPGYDATGSADRSSLNNTKTATNSSSSGSLTVDGIIGTLSTKKAQEIAGTPVDGIISGQVSSLKSAYPAITTCTYEGNGKSDFVKYLQKKLGVTQDGKLGTETITAWQKKLGVTADGVFGTNSAKALQNALNANKLY